MRVLSAIVVSLIVAGCSVATAQAPAVGKPAVIRRPVAHLNINHLMARRPHQTRSVAMSNRELIWRRTESNPDSSGSAP